MRKVTANLRQIHGEIEKILESEDSIYIKIQAAYAEKYGSIPSVGSVCNYLKNYAWVREGKNYPQRETAGRYYVQKGRKTYIMIQVEQGKWEFEHIAICKQNGSWFKGCVVHHADGNSCNNDPKNLMVMTRSDHARLHGLERGGDPDWRSNMSKKMKSVWARKKLEAKIAEIISEKGAA